MTLLTLGAGFHLARLRGEAVVQRTVVGARTGRVDYGYSVEEQAAEVTRGQAQDQEQGKDKSEFNHRSALPGSKSFCRWFRFHGFAPLRS